ncbi:MAG: molybdate ABC transporter substrate-binding protein [Alphaproteobacteria bacterium]
MLAGLTRRIPSCVFAAALAATPVLPAAAQDRPVLVFAAASLKNALDEINTAWQRDAGKRVTTSYAASPALAKQIEAGAPADLFISADLDWMDYLDQRKLLRAGTRIARLGNRIVLIAPAASTVTVTMGPNLPLAPLLGDGRLAMANTDAVPAGKYGKAALRALGAWDGVKDRIAQAENVRAALLLVARAEAPLGIVYRTDAAAEKQVKIVATFPASAHPPIVYPLAILAASTHADATAYAAYFGGPPAKAVLERHGFAVLGSPAN